MGIETRARLVESSFTGGVSMKLPRAEIERVIAEGDFPAWLELRVKRLEGEREEEAAVAVAWDEDELAELLRAADANEVTLLFDGSALAGAFDESDVEAHGLRERTAVLAVAVMAAGASAGIASAHTEGPGIGGAPAAAVSGTDVVAVPAGSKYVPQAGQTEVVLGGHTRAESAIGSAVSKTVEPDAVAVPAGSKYVPQAGQTEVVLGGASSGAAPAATGAATRIDGPDAVLVPPGSKYVPQPGQTVYTAPDASGTSGAASGTDVGTPSPSTLSAADDAAIAAGAALLIAAAGFAAAQTRRRPPRPA
jgi:hypothetical protein